MLLYNHCRGGSKQIPDNSVQRLSSCPPKTDSLDKVSINQTAAKRPMVAMDELQRPTAQMGESDNRKATNCAPQKSVLYQTIGRRNPLLKELLSVFSFPQAN